jgi:lysozyme family protein
MTLPWERQMRDDRMGRRKFLTMISSAATALAAPPLSGGAAAQDTAADGLAPSALERQLAALEGRARAVGLPESPFERRVRSAARLDKSNAYRQAMPRLIELIERSGMGSRSLEVGDGAAELLSRLHRQEYGPARVPGSGTRALRAPTLDSLRGEYRRMFRAASVRTEYRSEVAWHVDRLRRDRARYEALGAEVQIPWYFIGIIHGLEASFNFMGHLHNGDAPLSKRTRNLPANRPQVWLPPSDWESSAKDALAFDGFLGQSDWTLEAMLYRWEAYNGWGYRPRHSPTPYLWSFSNHYSRGKYAFDGRYDPQLRSQQCGAAVMLKELSQAGDVAQL